MYLLPLLVINTDKIYFDLTIVCALSNLYTARASYSLVAGSQNELSTTTSCMKYYACTYM